ncbi:MAG TPA: hypothetical protein VIL30_17300 [Ramlibacter sp.]
MNDIPQRTARVARSYWRCSECGANHALDVQACPACTGPDRQDNAPRRELGLRHWAALVLTWAAATVLWAVASGYLRA